MVTYKGDSCKEQPGIDKEGPASSLYSVEETQHDRRDEYEL